MPLTMRPTGLASPAYANWQDYTQPLLLNVKFVRE
jgi:hypothetical protein